MAFNVHLAYPWHCAGAMAAIFLALGIRYRVSYRNYYHYSLATFLKQQGAQASSFYSQFFFWIRLASLLLMALLVARPQWVDFKSKIKVEGIDIILALDVSGSMKCFDDLYDRRSRIEVAKKEALAFIDKRENDALGLVIFGKYAIARCPLTLDKNMIKSMVEALEIGKPCEDMEHSTVLCQSIIAAIRRLQKSQAKSKVIVLLTDGLPTPDDQIPVEHAISIAKKLHIKIYTIGIGSDQVGYLSDPILGAQPVRITLNMELLKKIASETDGKCFEAKKPKDLKTIYEAIDRLEKVSYETEVFNKYHDYFLPVLWLVIGLLLIELVMATFWWFIF